MKLLVYVFGLALFGFLSDLSSTSYFFKLFCPAMAVMCAMIVLIELFNLGKKPVGNIEEKTKHTGPRDNSSVTSVGIHSSGDCGGGDGGSC